VHQLKKGYKCNCGKVHDAGIDEYIVKNGAINDLPKFVKNYSCKKVFIVADVNTYSVAGEKVCNVLAKNEIEFSKYVFNNTALEPDEYAVGSAIMHFDKSCDIVVAIGSGVINDIGKILSSTAKIPYIIVATAPSMDGYASATSSMSMDGLKVSLPTKCANVIIGDTEILKNAPEKMLIAGLGDMLAKYISICEWRISNVITGEYFCDYVAQLIRDALKACADNAEGLLKRDEKAVEAVFEGLIIGGVAMKYAGLSRPASGVEHYFSHIWDMRGLEFGTNVDLHGIQCAIGTMYASKIYEQVKNIKIDKEKALSYASNFDYENYKNQLAAFIGKGATQMAEIEKREGKYNVEKHRERLEVIIKNWDKILEIINNEVPASKEIERIMDVIHAPKTSAEIGIDEKDISFTFKATKDIRDKYVLSRLCWDLGIIEEIKF